MLSSPDTSLVGMQAALTASTPDHNPSERGGTAMADENLTPYEERYPERVAAKGAVLAAVRGGVLRRPKECSACGTPSRLIDGHHDDYSKPLEVRWLCRGCHRAADRARDAALNNRDVPLAIDHPLYVGIARITCPGCAEDMWIASQWTLWTCWACRRKLTQPEREAVL